jgi:hypothetical protein
VLDIAGDRVDESVGLVDVEQRGPDRGAFAQLRLDYPAPIVS